MPLVLILWIKIINFFCLLSVFYAGVFFGFFQSLQQLLFMLCRHIKTFELFHIEYLRLVMLPAENLPRRHRLLTSCGSFRAQNSEPSMPLLPSSGRMFRVLAQFSYLFVDSFRFIVRHNIFSCSQQGKNSLFLPSA